MYSCVQIGDAFVDRVETVDVLGQRSVNKKCNASRHVVKTRAGEDVLVIVGGPKFVFVGAPLSLIVMTCHCVCLSSASSSSMESSVRRLRAFLWMIMKSWLEVVDDGEGDVVGL